VNNIKTGGNIHLYQDQPDWNMMKPYLCCLRSDWHRGTNRGVDGENGYESADINTVVIIRSFAFCICNWFLLYP